MIRRDDSTSGGRPGWALISQVEHARLSGEMATAWGSSACPKLEYRREMLPAIFQHDDGWAEWERHPGVDPANGRPLNFTEMRLDESLAIWQRSISAAAGSGPLAGYVVSGHFSALLRHQNAWQKMGSAHHDQARSFLDEQDRRRTDWLAQWQSHSPASRTEAAAEKGLHWLQFFDALSLWLCMARRAEPHAMPIPGGGELRLTPFVSNPAKGERIGLAPWPFSRPELPLGLSGRCVPVGHYRTSAELVDAPSATIMLNWLLMPAP
jgi:hypothetical protein